jgi:multiple sugar transport system permease protein
VPIKKPEVILAAILVILPVLLIFIVAQRFVRSGMLSGAEKG